MREYKPGDDYGRIIFDPDEVMRRQGTNDAELCEYARIRPEQLRHYRQDKIKKLSHDFVARLCYVLECQPGEIFRYIPAGEDSDVEEDSAAGEDSAAEEDSAAGEQAF